MKNILLYLIFLSMKTVLFSQEPINQMDSLKQKQGLWVYYSNDSIKMKSEEGFYIDNRKNGPWIKYFEDGKQIKIKAIYKNNRPFGPCWKYYRNGKLKMYQGSFGKIINDSVVEYDSLGTLRYKAVYDQYGYLCSEFSEAGGRKYDPLRTSYTRGQVYDVSDSTTIIKQQFAPILANPKTKNGTFNENGFNEVLTLDKDPLQVGLFKDGKLWDGKVYIYDRDGILLKVKVFKEGIYVGDGQL